MSYPESTMHFDPYGEDRASINEAVMQRVHQSGLDFMIPEKDENGVVLGHTLYSDILPDGLFFPLQIVELDKKPPTDEELARSIAIIGMVTELLKKPE